MQVVGYAADAATFCPECAGIRYGFDPSAPNDLGAMFTTDEADCPQCCSDCGGFIPSALTEDGVDYVRRWYALDTTPFATDEARAIAREWFDYYGADVCGANDTEEE